MRQFPTAHTDTPKQRDVYTVERLNNAARGLLESQFAQVWVEGEVSNLSAPASGHLYFTLKDARAQIRCAYFRSRQALLDYLPAEGMQVLMRARLTIFEPRGDLQLVVQHLEPAGAGALRERFERLKQALQREGLFDAARKKAVPEIPQTIGVVTSTSGAAVRDIITTCRRRFAAIPVVVYPTAVQGPEAVDGIVNALAVAARRRECSVLIVARGGGTLEDLWAFNEERVARAIAASDIPVVTGVGHEIDSTIADFVADRRAPTPTAAAELVTPDASILARRVTSSAASLQSSIERRIEQLMQRNDLLAHRLIHPTRRYAQARHAFQLLYTRLVAALNTDVRSKRMLFTARSRTLLQYTPQRRFAHAEWRLRSARTRLTRSAGRLSLPQRLRFEACVSRLNAVSPLATLQRGYAVVTDASGAVITRADTVAVGAKVDVRLARGGLDCRVEKTRD